MGVVFILKAKSICDFSHFEFCTGAELTPKTCSYTTNQSLIDSQTHSTLVCGTELKKADKDC